jgi:hypothetical protein
VDVANDEQVTTVGVSTGVQFEDDQDHIHSDWRSASTFLGLLMYHACLSYVQSRIEGVVRRVWTRGMMAQETM